MLVNADRTTKGRPFWANVHHGEGCWEWIGHKNPAGYGIAFHEGKQKLAHRIVWMTEHGQIPAGMQVCHRCDNPSCVRPDHLFLGTNMDNARDMAAKGRQWQQLKTHCKHGHEFTPENTYAKRGRACKECVRRRGREMYRRQNGAA